MPKERINNSYHGQYATDHSKCEHDAMTNPSGDCKGLEGPMDDSFVHLGWTKDHMHVEIAILKDSDEGNHEDRWFSQLDRPGVNRLIRALRQARDDAFGKDQ